MSEAETDWLDFFSGGVPTGEYFRGTLGDLREISEGDSSQWSGINRVQEICFIGLFSYFEAFCKDHFASLINLEPSLITNLKRRGQDVSIDASQVALYGVECERRLGFLVASKFDFGSARKINALFSALISVSPFNSADADRFERLLRDRNLLVHHGGVFTLTYLEQQTDIGADHKRDAFFYSKVITRAEVLDAITFIEEIARKLLRASHDALTAVLDGSTDQDVSARRTALEYLVWWGDKNV